MIKNCLFILVIFALNAYGGVSYASPNTSVNLRSLKIIEDNLHIEYSKNFSTCAHLYNSKNKPVHRQNFFCTKGENIKIATPIEKLSLDSGPFKLCHGNNAHICSKQVAILNPLDRTVLTVIIELENLANNHSDKYWSDIVKSDNPSDKTASSFWFHSSLGKAEINLAEENYGNKNDGVIRITMPPEYTESNLRDKAIRGREIYKEALYLIDEYIDFSIYDKNNDGLLDTSRELAIAFVLPKNYGASVQGTSISETFDGIKLAQFSHNPQSWKPLSENRMSFIKLGTYGKRSFSHEIGHLLYGLKDLYSAIRPRKLSAWGIMSSNHRDILSSYSAYMLDWGVGKEVEEGRGIIIDSLAPASVVGPRVYRVSTDNPKEYFLLQNVGGIINVTHITEVKDATVYRPFNNSTEENNSFIFRYLSNHNEGTPTGKTIKDIAVISDYELEFNITNNITHDNKVSELLRPVLKAKGGSNRTIKLKHHDYWLFSVPRKNLTHFAWMDVGAEKYGVTITVKKENSENVVYNNMQLEELEVEVPYFLDSDKSTIEVRLSTYLNNSWSHKVYYFFNNYEESLHKPTIIEFLNTSDSGVKLSWLDNDLDNTGYFIFGDGFLLATIDGDATEYTHNLPGITHYSIIAFNNIGDISSSEEMPVIINKKDIGMTPQSGETLSSSTVTFQWDDFASNYDPNRAARWGKYLLVASSMDRLGAYGKCRSFDKPVCKLSGLSGGDKIKITLRDITDNSDRYIYSFIYIIPID